MAERYISIDSGKFASKISEYIPEYDGIRKFQIRTKVSEGDFRDDAIEKNTVIIGLQDENGKEMVYKVGNGARGAGVELTTDKRTDTHKIAILTALATLASDNEKDVMNVAIGLPVQSWASVSIREDYKAMMLPEGEIRIKIKKSSDEPVKEKIFSIKNRYVFPESIGALFMDDSPEISQSSITGVIDIGNLNLNACLFQGTEVILDKSVSADLGGSVLISELSQALSEITTVDELICANILKMNPEERCLPSVYLSEEDIEKSRDIIKKVLVEHAKKIKRECQRRNWSLDVTNIVAIGGTSKDLEVELKEVFGPQLTVLDNTEYCNSLGYLRLLCERQSSINKLIPLSAITPNSQQKEINKKEAKAAS